MKGPSTASGNAARGQLLQWAAVLLFFAFLPLARRSFFITMANEILIMGLFAMAFNLLYGVTGMLSFGQAAYYGVGGYTVGLLLTKGVLPSKCGSSRPRPTG